MKEPVAIVPVMCGAEQVVLLGDEHQLPPTVKRTEAIIAGLGYSLFARLVASRCPVHTLSTQYRMHPMIARYPFDTFYKDIRVENHFPAERFPKICGFSWPARGPVCVIDNAHGEESTAIGIRNKGRCELIAQIVVDIMKGCDQCGKPCGLSPRQIGVLCAYRAQCHLMRETLATMAIHDIDVGTIDCFQGREYDLVIASTVRSSQSEHLGFLASGRRLNVALTRARRGLIVICNYRKFGRSPWSEYVRWAMAKSLTDSDF